MPAVRALTFAIGILMFASGECLARPMDAYPALMDTLVGGHYSAADSICRRLEAEYGAEPAILYAKATVRYAHMIDLEDTLGRAEFMKLTDSCAAQADLCKELHPARRAEWAFLRGSALASRGLLLAREKRLLAALQLLMDARSEFDQAIEADPEFYDAYLGRGAYRYAVASYAGLLRWLPLIPSRAEGWNDMWLAVQRSRFSTYAALTSLVWFALDDRNYALTDSICRAGLSRFPGARSFLWPKLALEFRQSQWEDAMQTSRELLRQYLLLPENNGYEAIGLYHKLSACADSLGLSDQAREFAKAGLTTFRTEDVALRRKHKLEELRVRAGK